MANYETLRDNISQAIRPNDNNEITGLILQQALLSIINSFSTGYQFRGIADPSLDPGTLSDQKEFYIAAQGGTYSKFSNPIVGDIVLNPGEIAVLIYDWFWRKISICNLLDIVDSSLVDLKKESFYHYIRFGAELSGNITAQTSIQPNTILDDHGKVTNFDNYSVCTIRNNGGGNLYIANNHPDLYFAFSSVCLYDSTDDRLVYAGNLLGYTVVAIPTGMYAKVTLSNQSLEVHSSLNIIYKKTLSTDEITTLVKEIVAPFDISSTAVLSYLSNLVPVAGIEESSPCYYNYDGEVVPWPYGNILSKHFNIEGGKTYYINSGVSGGATHLAIEVDSQGNVIARHNPGEDNRYDTYTRYKLDTDPRAVKLLCSRYQDPRLGFGYAELYDVDGYQSFEDRVKEQVDETVGSYWLGKRGVWLGTSISQVGMYPEGIAKILGMAKMDNLSQGSSMCRIGKPVTNIDPLLDDLGVTDVPWVCICYSLSMTQEEKKYIFERWTTDERKAKLIQEGYTPQQVANVVGYANYMQGTFIGEEGHQTTGDKPNDIMASEYDNFRKECYSYCWNNSTNIEPNFGQINGIIERYLTPEAFPDIWFIDHSHNDGIFGDDNVFPTEVFNRHYYIGAMNFIINKILQYNPKTTIILIGHYTNQRGATNNPSEICEGWEKIANYWQLPRIKTWEMLPFSQAIISTNGYYSQDGTWHDSGYDGSILLEGALVGNHYGINYSGINTNSRNIGGIWYHDMTMKQIYMQDDLHPTSKYCQELYTHKLAGAINSILK